MRILAGVAIALSSASMAAADSRRDAPACDGRGNTDTNAGSWALWMPRVALSPLYVVNEDVVRRPLGGLVTVAERRDRVNAVSDFFEIHACDLGPRGMSVVGVKRRAR